MSDVLLDNRVSVNTSTGEHDLYAHAVAPAGALTNAIINQTPITALCGKTWVPSRDPKKYPICPTCKEILHGLGQSPENAK